MNVKEREIVGAVLRAVGADVTERILPNLVDADAQRSARMMQGLLNYLAAWHLEVPRTLPKHIAARQSIAGVEPNTAMFTSDIPLDAAYGAFGAAIQSKVEAEDRVDRALFDEVASQDFALLDEERLLVTSGAQSALDRRAAVEVEVNPQLATEFVNACCGRGHEVKSVLRAPGGYSKDTLFVDVSLPERRGEAQYVVRRDLPFGPGGTTVVDEYKLLTGLFNRGIPIAKPLGLDASGILGTAAMLSERVGGKSRAEALSSKSADSICRKLACTLARLHRLSPAQVGVTVSSNDPREIVRAYVLGWRERWRAHRVHASPTLAAAFAWMLGNIPKRIDGLAIVHGDVGFHNTMVDGGKLTALLDWEFAHLGDATEDLSYCRPAVEQFMAWEDFLATYEREGGGEYRQQNATFFELWRSVRNAVTCSSAWFGFLNGAYPALKMAYQGIPLYRSYVREVAHMLANTA